MEHYNDKLHWPANADHHLSTQGDTHAPATLLPAVLSRLGLNNGQAPHPATTQNALTDLHSSDWHVRVAAVRTLGKQGQQAPIEHLLVALQDEDGSVRAATVHVLATLEERAPIEQLIAALHDLDWHVRETAVLALGKLRQPLPDDVFNAALHDQDSAVREAAQLATRWSRQGVLNELPPTVTTPASNFPSAQNYLSTKNKHVKQITNGNTSGDIIREQQEQRQHQSQRMSEQQMEYEYYGYQEGGAPSQWEKATSYTPRKNHRPLWIGGSIGIVAFLIVAAASAGFGAFFFVHSPSGASKIEFIKPTMMSKSMATPELQQQAIYIYQNHHDVVNAVAWSPDSTRIASASDDKTVQVWDALTGNNPFVFGGHTAQVDTVAWSPNGQLIASGSVDGTIEVWDPNNGRIDLTYHFAAVADSQHIGALQAFSGGGDPGTYTLVWSPDGSRIAAAMGSSAVKVFDARTGNTLLTYRGFAGKIDAMAWSPDGKYIVTAGERDATTVWNASNGNTVFTSPVSDSNAVFSLAWAPDSQRVALGYLDGSVRVWNPFIGNMLALSSHSQNVYALAWSPDGSLLATASIDNTVQVVNATTGMQILVYSGHANELRTVAWSPNGSFIVSGSTDDTVQVWKAP